MKKLAFILLTAVFTFPLFANNLSDTTIVIENRKIQMIDDENRLRVRVFDLTEEDGYVERDLIFEGHYRDGVVHERRHVSRTVSVPVPTIKPYHHLRNRGFRPHWSAFGIGFNSFTHNGLNNINDFDDFSLNSGKSLEYSLNLAQKAVPVSRNFAFVTGIGMKWNRFHLNDNQYFTKSDGKTVILPAEDGVNFRKTRLGVNSITVPLMFEWQLKSSHSRNNYFYTTAGAVGNWNYRSRSKIHYHNSQERWVQEIVARDLYVRPVTVDLMVQLGINNWGALYAKYSPMNLFQKDRGPVVQPVSVGIMFPLNWH
jgi:hypothetical protein